MDTDHTRTLGDRRQWAESREPGCIDRMMALADKLQLTADDLRHLPHHIAAEIAEGCRWDGEYWARQEGRQYTEEDWHATFQAEADMALAGGLEGIITYLLSNLWEASVANFLHNPTRDAHLTSEQVARRYRLALLADATFPRRLFHKQSATT